MCCEMCELCWSCQREADEKQDREEMVATVKEWNWNLSPAEVAQQIRQLDGRWSEEDMVEEVRSQYGEDAAWQVEDVLAIL